MENFQHGRMRHLYNTDPVFGVSPFLPSINLLTLQAALVALLTAYSTCCMKVSWLSSQTPRYLIQSTCSTATPCKVRLTVPPVDPNSITLVFDVLSVISHSSDQLLSSSNTVCKLLWTVAKFFATAEPTKSSANFGRIHLGVSCTYDRKRSAPSTVPAEVLCSDLTHPPIRSFTLTRACRPDRKLTKYSSKWPEILKFFTGL